MADAEGKIALGVLLDFYGPMLTEHRREIVHSYCEEDMSLGEIASSLGITRQGVSDALNKARRQLEGFEAQLGLAERYRAIHVQAEQGLMALERADIAGAREAFNRIIQIER